MESGAGKPSSHENNFTYSSPTICPIYRCAGGSVLSNWLTLFSAKQDLIGSHRQGTDLKGVFYYINGFYWQSGCTTQGKEARQMSKILLAMIVAVSLALLGIPSFATAQAGPQHDANMSMMQNCPMKVPGAELSVADAENGIILEITTKSGQVAELRRRTESMAQMHSGASHRAMHPGMVPFSFKYEEIANGARLTLIPKDPSQLDAFRATVRQHAEQMKKGQCSMMQGMMEGMKNPPAQPETKPKSEEEEHSEHHPPGEKK